MPFAWHYPLILFINYDLFLEYSDFLQNRTFIHHKSRIECRHTKKCRSCMKLMTWNAFYLVTLAFVLQKKYSLHFALLQAVLWIKRKCACMNIYRHYLIKVTPPAKSTLFVWRLRQKTYFNRNEKKEMMKNKLWTSKCDVFIRSLSFLAYAVNFNISCCMQTQRMESEILTNNEALFINLHLACVLNWLYMLLTLFHNSNIASEIFFIWVLISI